MTEDNRLCACPCACHCQCGYTGAIVGLYAQNWLLYALLHVTNFPDCAWLVGLRNRLEKRCVANRMEMTRLMREHVAKTGVTPRWWHWGTGFLTDTLSCVK